MNSNIGGTAFNWVRTNTGNLIGMDPTGPGGTTTIPGALTNITTTQQQSVFTIIGVANGCTSAGVNVTVTVNPPPTVANITGLTSVCQFATITLADATGGGAWSSSNTGVATVNAGSGVVSGVASGSTVITYTVTDGNGCTNSTTYPISVGQSPTITSVTATPTTICAGQTSNLLAVVPGSTPTTVCQTNNARAGFQQGSPDLTRTVNIAGIPAGVTITGITVTVNASHQRDNEVEMYLIPPGSDGGVALGGPGGGFQHTTTAGGNIMLLGTPVGTPVNGVNYVNTVFSDLGATTIAASGGSGPYTGTYKPASNPFTSITPAAANSANVNGTWTFVILDHVNSGFTGVFNNYTLCITYTSSNVTYAWSTIPPSGFTSTLANPPVTPGATTTYSVTATATNGCSSAPGTVTVTVNPAPSITLGANPTVCRGTTTANLPYTATTGAPNRYSITYNAAALAAGFVNVNNAVLPATPIVLTVPAGAAAATYNGTLTVTNSASGCASTAVPFTVTVSAAPTITLGANPTVCSGTTTANLPYTATTGGPNQYSITYSAAALAAGFVNVNNAVLPATPIVLEVTSEERTGRKKATRTLTNNA